MLNGVLTNCFADANGLHYVATGAPEACFYNGPSGDSIPFDLVYTEGYGGDARLQMAVPEPDILSLLGVGLLGLYGCRSLFHTKMTALLR